MHDFIDPELGRVIPYGVYDLAYNEGWVSVGESAEFGVASIRRWWRQMGKNRFPDATRLLITADASGSGGYRIRAWKVHLAALAAETGLDITVCHYPPGTSKWNRIEHAMFSFMTMNWRGRPLTSYRTIIELISATTTQTGLTIQAGYDPAEYLKGVKITDTELAAVPLTPTTGMANGTTPSTPDQIRREPFVDGARDFCVDLRFAAAVDEVGECGSVLLVHTTRYSRGGSCQAASLLGVTSTGWERRG